MCTAIKFKGTDNYFGRTLDVETDYKTSVVITPRNYFNGKLSNNYAIIGMAMIIKDYPLYFDGANEYGLSMAGLNFPGNCKYFKEKKDKNNLAVFELIPYILGKCKTVSEAKAEFYKINVTDSMYNNIPSSPLHWIISDKNSSITCEQTEKGMCIYDNNVNVLTNNPCFDWHITNLVNYMNITTEEPSNRFLNGIDLKAFCKGLGGVGLPGDLSSPSRFIRATFGVNRAKVYENEEKNVSQFFHILSFVEQTTGLSQAGNSFEQTLYTSCINMDKGIYYYKTYFNSNITGVDMHKYPLDSRLLTEIPLKYDTEIFMED